MQDDETQIDSVSLRRERCFGTCPVYEVTLAADGTATWDGKMYVDRMGQHVSEVDLADFSSLALFIQRIGFCGWAADYVGPSDCLPDYFLTVVIDGRAKTVHQYALDEPPDFWVIAALVDHLAEGLNWTPTGLNTNKVKHA